MKKTVVTTVAALLVAACLAGCGTGENGETFNKDSDIAVISREEGSGTRGAFVELFGIEEEDADGNTVDKTVATAEQTNSTAVMMTSVNGNPYAIGYTSLGVLNDTVKAVKIDGAEATVDNILSGTYKISRPFIVGSKADASDAAKDFLAYIMSDEGQKVITDEGYVSVGSNGAYTATEASGNVVIAGSSSVTPLMEKLVEDFESRNSNITVDVQQSDSSTGISSLADGTCDLGMASRELKDTETAKGITGTVIAQDGIAVIVNNENPIEELTPDQVKQIFTGAETTWANFIQ